ncbi:hypothetical protein NHQ30_004242 [Ciborinia camelliae]|nr:hypothetical protein NHQ30_004242 [Ciborinia camelliae]
MKPSTGPESGKYEFITSTPFYSAKEKKETKTLVRKHVMRPFMKQNRPKRANGLKNITLAPRVSIGASQLQPSTTSTNEEEAEAEIEYGVPISSQTNSMVLLGSGRVNPFQAWPIKMDMQEYELVHHKLRGGLSSIENVPPLRLSLFWIEHNMSSDLDTAPRFPAPLQYLTNPYIPKYQAEGEVHFSEACKHSGITFFLSDNMLGILRELSILTVIIIRESEKRNLSSDIQFLWGDQNFAGLCLYPILSSLLFLQKETKDATEELGRIGGLLFLAQARKWFGVGPVLTNILLGKLHRLLEDARDIWDPKVKNLRIWTLVMAFCAASTEDERAWVVEALRRDVFPWTELQSVKKMWWIDELFQIALSDIEMALY